MRRSLLIGVGCAAALSGCLHPAINDSARVGPFFVPHNLSGEARMPPELQRVVLLPLHGGSVASRETVENLDPILTDALQRQQRFEVVVVSRDEFEKTFGATDLSSASPLPHDFLKVLGDKYGAQGVLFVDLTAYGAYRPLTLGLRAKLADVATHRLIWSFDQIFSTGNPEIANSLRHFYLHNDRGNVPFDLSTDALQSPGRFAGYAADAAFRTLPPR